MRAGLEAWLHRQWARRGWFACALAPLALIFWLIVRRRGRPQRADHPAPLPRPVVVVGNIYVGGTGKTPVTIALVNALRARGWRPGVISRGWGRADAAPVLLGPASTAAEVGDEPLLIARATGVPVAVARQRHAAGSALIEAHPECDVLVADDGLQHRGLWRDFEIAVIGARGLGNRWVLPAGPLREPPARLASVDAVVLNDAPADFTAPVPSFRATSRLGPAEPLSGGAAIELAELTRRQREQGLRILAAAGIGAPERFFAMLRAAGLTIDTLALPDHYDFAQDPFAARAADLILITAKDAVKCAALPTLARDARLHVVGLALSLDEALIDAVSQCIKESPWIPVS